MVCINTALGVSEWRIDEDVNKTIMMRLSIIYRSSHQRCSLRKGVIRNFAKFTGKHLCQRLFFNKVAGLTPATLLKKRLWHRCFPVNFAKFLRTPFYRTPLGDCFCIDDIFLNKSQQTFTCPKLIIETHEKGVKSVQG